MIRLKTPVIVEGKYDKIRLSNIIDAPIFTTDGFRIFKDKEKIEFFRAVAEKSGIIILTDSDSAGQMIRNHLKKAIGDTHIYNVYLPEILGKERRKSHPSKEGLLGVEGTDDAIIIKAIERFTAEKSDGKKVNKTDFLLWGLSGDGSVIKREKLKERLSLPKALSTNGLLDAINVLYTYEEIEKIVGEI